MYEYWYAYVKPKYGEIVKRYDMDTDSFILHVRIDGIFKNIVEDVETRFDTSNIKINRPLPKRKNVNIIELIKDE